MFKIYHVSLQYNYKSCFYVLPFVLLCLIYSFPDILFIQTMLNNYVHLFVSNFIFSLKLKVPNIYFSYFSFKFFLLCFAIKEQLYIF